MTDTADQVIRARLNQDTKALLERAARAEGLSLSEWMRFHLIRIAEEVLARRRQIKLPRPERISTSRFVR